MNKVIRSENSRLNGAKSVGPITAEGKLRSSMNAFKHGRYANNAIVLSNEDVGAFDELVQAYIERVRPVDPIELGIARELASIEWRLARILALDSRLLDHEMDVQAPAVEMEHGTPSELTRLVLAGRNVVEKSRFPAYLSQREGRLLAARQNAYRTLEILRKRHPRIERAAEVNIPQPLNPEIEVWNEPGTNPAEDPQA